MNRLTHENEIKIIKDLRNLLDQKKEIDDTTIADIRYCFRLKQ